MSMNSNFSSDLLLSSQAKRDDSLRPEAVGAIYRVVIRKMSEKLEKKTMERMPDSNLPKRSNGRPQRRAAVKAKEAIKNDSFKAMDDEEDGCIEDPMDEEESDDKGEINPRDGQGRSPSRERFLKTFQWAMMKFASVKGFLQRKKLDGAPVIVFSFAGIKKQVSEPISAESSSLHTLPAPMARLSLLPSSLRFSSTPVPIMRLERPRRANGRRFSAWTMSGAKRLV